MDSTMETILLVIALVLTAGGALICLTDKAYPSAAIGIGAALTAVVLLFN